MDLGLAGKNAVVVGASSGLGFEVVKLLLQEGSSVLGIARDQQKLRIAESELEGVASQASFSSLALDVSVESSIKVLEDSLSSYEKLDLLVVCAGNGSPIPGTLANAFYQSASNNLTPALFALEACLPFLGRSKDAAVILVSSIAGLEDVSAPVEYSATKAALHVYTSHFARKHAPIRFLTVAPGNFLSGNSVWAQRLDSDPLGLAKYLEDHVPLNRLGSVNEIANMIAFLGSPASSFTTGAVFTIDGGQSRAF